MISAALLISVNGYSQDIKDSVPDGTEGEMFHAPEKDSTKLKWNEKRWRLFKGRITTFKLGAGFLYEYAGFSQDKNSKAQMDSLGTPMENQFKVRDFRVLFSGQFKTKRSISWRAGIMYDGAIGFLAREGDRYYGGRSGNSELFFCRPHQRRVFNE